MVAEAAKSNGMPPRVLDAGGRKSPYTIGLSAQVTILDLPRETEVQESLHLGINDAMIEAAKKRRSNVVNIRYGDMTAAPFAGATFDIVVAVEVLEHVDEDERFAFEVARVLKPTGRFLMTTPNGDNVPNTNPDHRRHYKRDQLKALLDRYFDEVEVYYAIPESRARQWGLQSWCGRAPIVTVKSMIGNVIAYREAVRADVKRDGRTTHHLIAEARWPVKTPREVG